MKMKLFLILLSNFCHTNESCIDAIYGTCVFAWAINDVIEEYRSRKNTIT